MSFRHTDRRRKFHLTANCPYAIIAVTANKLISRVTQFPVHDLGCTLKAIRREVAIELELYGEMHRFIPILADMRGARCFEMEVKHHPRIYGKTKYGIDRTVRVLLDLITVAYLKRYSASPMKLFGRWALMSCLLSCLLFVSAGVYGALTQEVNVPLLVGGLSCSGLAGQFFGLGWLAEMASRIYFAGRSESVYAVRHRWDQRNAAAAPAHNNPATKSGIWRKAG